MNIKKFFAALAVLASVSAYGFSESVVNITIPENLGIHARDDASFAISAFGLTGEYLGKIGDGSFCLGGKLGFEYDQSDRPHSFTRVYVDDLDSHCTMLGFTVCPALGWSFGDTTKKQIMLYPLMYSGYRFTDLNDDDDNSLNKDMTLDLVKTGAAFSWQWGNKVWNGFEIGFDFDWYAMFKLDGKKVTYDEDEDENGTGIDFHIAYKLSFDI